MKTRPLLLLAVVGFCLLAVVVIVVLWKREPPGPLYGGKTIDAWALQLMSPDVHVSDQAAIELKEIGSNGIPRLVRLLRARDSLISERIWPLPSKWPLRSRAVVQHLVPPPSAMSLRASAARSLGILGPAASPAAPALVKALQDPVDEVRWNAARTLGKIGKDAVSVLLEAVQDKDAHVRLAAVYALGEIGPNAEAAIPALIQALGDPAPAVRASALNGLCSIGPAALRPLMDCVETGNGLAQQGATEALIRLHPPPSQDGLLKMMRAEKPESRRMAIDLLIAVGVVDRAVLSALSAATNDSANSVRAAAKAALRSFGAAAASKPAPR